MTRYSEDDLLPISALQHYIYCPRQCALIHLEQAWAENRLTAEGRVLHHKAHEGLDETRPGVRTVRGLPVRSLTDGLSGQCDVVEFRGWESGMKAAAGTLPGGVKLVPVEYKRGKPKAHRADEVQVCAQAICLEEMFGLEPGRIPRALLYYGESRRRHEIGLDLELRELTRDTAARLHALIAAGRTPLAYYDRKRCSRCSLLELCEPRAMRLARGTRAWFERELKDIEEEGASCGNT